ncbi:MAG: hypothetical protein ACYTED_20470 [Planctomycetota bacterium]|jgi:hypothetical protein
MAIAHGLFEASEAMAQALGWRVLAEAQRPWRRIEARTEVASRRVAELMVLTVASQRRVRDDLLAALHKSMRAVVASAPVSFHWPAEAGQLDLEPSLIEERGRFFVGLSLSRKDQGKRYPCR